MMNLSQDILGNPLSQWLVAFGIAVSCYFLLRLIRRVIIRRLARLSESTQTHVDDLVSEVLSGTRSFFLVAISLSLGSRALERTDMVTNVIGGLTMVAILLQVGIWISRGVGFMLTRTLSRGEDSSSASSTMLTPLMFLTRLLIWSVILLVALDNFGVDVTALITGLGIGGVAIALALQTVLGDLFASLSIVLDKPFVIGDFITVGEFSGTVEHVGLKTTRVRSLSGEQVVFSNSDLLNGRIRNFKRMSERRILFTVGVTYQTPLESLRRIPEMIRSIIGEQAKARLDRSHFKGFGDSSLDFETVYFVLEPDYAVYMDVQQTINLEIVRQFSAAGIEFAYPTRTLFVAGDEHAENSSGSAVKEGKLA
jgi:small-conductance mechanosensitive channel